MDGYSQDNLTYYSTLVGIISLLKSKSGMDELRKEEARKLGSHYRNIIESGLDRLDNLNQDNIPYLFLAAIALGGPTLQLFSKAILHVSTKTTEGKQVFITIESELVSLFGFSEVFAKWLSINLHRLTESSIHILEALDVGELDNECIRFSTVTSLPDAPTIVKFKGTMKCITQGMNRPRRNALESAIRKCDESDSLLKLPELIRIIKFVLNRDFDTKGTYVDTKITNWITLMEQDKQQVDWPD